MAARLSYCQENKTRILLPEQTGNPVENPMLRLVRETMALASVGGFVWMVCSVTQFVA